MNGKFAEARRLHANGIEILNDLGRGLDAAGSAMVVATMEMLAAQPNRAEEALMPACELLVEMGETGFLSTLSALLSQACAVQGKIEMAEQYAQQSAETTAPDDIWSMVLLRIAQSQIASRLGRGDEARKLGVEAVHRVSKTDFVNMKANAIESLAGVYERDGQIAKAAVAYKNALSLYQRKGNIVSAARMQAALRELQKAI